MNAQGKDAKACMQSTLADLNPESTVVLEKFGLTAPEEMMDCGGKTVALVDFSDIGQAPAGITEAEVVTIVDHHKVGDVTTNQPILVRVEPVGCTGTVLKQLYDQGIFKMGFALMVGWRLSCA